MIGTPMRRLVRLGATASTVLASTAAIAQSSLSPTAPPPAPSASSSLPAPKPAARAEARCGYAGGSHRSTSLGRQAD